MRVTVPEISFHNRDPVLSVDIQHNSKDGITRMATGGTDTHVVIWQLHALGDGGLSIEVLSDLVRHNRAVNAVSFCPDGSLLASADDEAAIIVWKKQDAPSVGAAPELFSEDEVKNKENWTIYKMLRGHIEDVYDLSWSMCGNFMISGSIDNSAIMWDVHKARNVGLLKDHKNFVQGVAWDPLGQFVATLSCDRMLRWFSVSSKRVVYKAQKAMLPLLPADGQPPTLVSTKLFYDDTLKSFCRRLCFSPDGLLLVAPAGILEDEQPGSRPRNVVHVFTRLSPLRPVMYLPTGDKYTVAVRFSPLLYTLKRGRPDTEYSGQSVFALPYRMVFAVACQNCVLLYDTQQSIPFARISNMHYTRLTDLAWSADGRILAISSTDGYCSLVHFEEGELGDQYTEHGLGDRVLAQLRVDKKLSGSKSTKKLASCKAMPKDGAVSKKVLVEALPVKSLLKANPGAVITSESSIVTENLQMKDDCEVKIELHKEESEADGVSKENITEAISSRDAAVEVKSKFCDNDSIQKLNDKDESSEPMEVSNGELHEQNVSENSTCESAPSKFENNMQEKKTDLMINSTPSKPKINILQPRRAPKAIFEKNADVFSASSSKNTSAVAMKRVVKTRENEEDSESVGSADSELSDDDSEQSVMSVEAFIENDIPEKVKHSRQYADPKDEVIPTCNSRTSNVLIPTRVLKNYICPNTENSNNADDGGSSGAEQTKNSVSQSDDVSLSCEGKDIAVVARNNVKEDSDGESIGSIDTESEEEDDSHASNTSFECHHGDSFDAAPRDKAFSSKLDQSPSNAFKSFGAIVKKSPTCIPQTNAVKSDAELTRTCPLPPKEAVQPLLSRPPRRVPLITLSRPDSTPKRTVNSSFKINPSGDEQLQHRSDSSVVLSENTADLCLRLEGGDTVSSPVKPVLPIKTEESARSDTQCIAECLDNGSGTPKQSCTPLSTGKTPRRVSLITLSSPKAKKSLNSAAFTQKNPL